MDEALRRAGWICIVAISGAYMTYLVAGSFISQETSVMAEPIVVRDAIGKGEHHISGMVMVPSNCDELTLVVERLEESLYQLTFATWTEPAVKCDNQPSPRVFETIVFAPSYGVRFVATLDGVPIKVAMYPSFRE